MSDTDRFFADAESLAEQGIACGVADASSLLESRGIAVHVVRGVVPRLHYDVYVDLPGQGFVIVEDEPYGYYDDGGSCQYDDGAARVGARRFRLGLEGEDSWRNASRAFCRILNWIMDAHGCRDRAFSLYAGHNDHVVVIGSLEMAREMKPVNGHRLELWPELADPGLHDFVWPDPELVVGESDLADVERLHVIPTPLVAQVLTLLNPLDHPPWTYDKTRVYVGNLARVDEGVLHALGLDGLRVEVTPDADGRGVGHVIAETGDPARSFDLVAALHNRDLNGRRVVAQAARRPRTFRPSGA